MGLRGGMWCYVVLCEFMRRYVGLYGVLWGNVALCCVMLRYGMLCDVV